VAYPPVGIVVLNYATPAETVECVRKLRDQDYPCFEIFIVDNASPDGSEQRLRAELPGETIVQRGRNLGYGDGNNLGMEIALRCGAEFVWIVSPDVHAAPDCLAHLVALMRSAPDIGISGPVIQADDRTVVRWTLAEALGFQAWAHTVSECRLAAQPERLDTGFVEGGAILIRATVVREIGAFRTDFFLYYEECEYCLRARDAGWALAVCTRARVRTRRNKDNRNTRYYYMTRNSIALARLRRRYVARSVAKSMLLLPLYMLLKGQKASTGLRAVRDGLRMSLTGSTP
jgi:GT2 family glycosyltransferase